MPRRRVPRRRMPGVAVVMPSKTDAGGDHRRARCRPTRSCRWPRSRGCRRREWTTRPRGGGRRDGKCHGGVWDFRGQGAPAGICRRRAYARRSCAWRSPRTPPRTSARWRLPAASSSPARLKDACVRVCVCQNLGPGGRSDVTRHQSRVRVQRRVALARECDCECARCAARGFTLPQPHAPEYPSPPRRRRAAAAA
jgi:hypothetical protein